MYALANTSLEEPRRPRLKSPTETQRQAWLFSTMAARAAAFRTGIGMANSKTRATDVLHENRPLL